MVQSLFLQTMCHWLGIYEQYTQYRSHSQDTHTHVYIPYKQILHIHKKRPSFTEETYRVSKGLIYIYIYKVCCPERTYYIICLISGGGSLLLGLSSLSESILESPGKSLHVTHTSSSNSTLSLGLFSPVVRSHLLVGVSTGGASLFLNVEGSLSATTARGV